MTDAVPTDEQTHDCPYCDRPFAREEWRDLHLGLEHPERLDEEEVAAFRSAYDEEAASIRRFRLRALGALVAIYFGLLMVYALV